jgi:hypothetical protein
METKRKPPNPNGNPNFRSRWDNLGETSTVRLPQSLHLVFKDLASDINDGKVKLSDLKSSPDLLEKLNQFEELQRQSWGKSNKQIGEFTTNSPRWTKYNEFKAWLVTQLP